jgi:hypothetical protein
MSKEITQAHAFRLQDLQPQDRVVVVDPEYEDVEDVFCSILRCDLFAARLDTLILNL